MRLRDRAADSLREWLRRITGSKVHECAFHSAVFLFFAVAVGPVRASISQAHVNIEHFDPRSEAAHDCRRKITFAETNGNMATECDRVAGNCPAGKLPFQGFIVQEKFALVNEVRSLHLARIAY